MTIGSDFRQRQRGVTVLTYALLVALAAMSALSLSLVEKQLIAVAGHALALAIIATAVLPLALMLLWSARCLRREWAATSEREQWLGTTLRSIGDGVVSTDAAGRVTSLNAAAERLTAWSESEARGCDLAEVMRLADPSTRQPVENPALAAIRNGAAFPPGQMAHLRARDGAERTITVDAAPIRNQQHEIIGCVIVLRDVTDRELADSALKASQAMFGTITEHISDLIAVLDLAGRRLYNSASYERLLAPAGDLYHTDSFANIHPDDRERIKELFAEIVETGEKRRAEYRLIDKNGDTLFIESLGSAIHGADGRPEKILVVSRDNTERHRAEERLRQEKVFSETLINSMPGIFYLCSEDRKLLRWNRNLEIVTQRTYDEIEEMNPDDLFPPEHLSLTLGRFRRCFEIGRSDVEVPLVSKDGTRTPYYFTGVRVHVEGRPCMLGVGIDITERTRAEESVRSTMRRLGRQNRALSEHARTPILGQTDLAASFQKITEVAARTLEVNRASIWLYNEPCDAIHCEDLFDERDRTHRHGRTLAARDYPAYFTALGGERAIAVNDARTDPRTQEFTADYLTPLGIASMLDAPIRSGGKMIGVLCNEHTGAMRAWTPDEQNFAGSMADVVSLSLETAQRQRAEAALREAHDLLEEKVATRTRDLAEANERLQELDRLKSEFLAMMSHELRTPLNSIIGFTGILRQGLAGPLNEEQLKQLGMVHFSARHLLGLINDLLDLSRIESGKMEVVAETFPLEDVVREVVESLTPSAQQKGLSLTSQIEPAQVPLRSDRKKVFQILLNLANNAVKFTEKGGVRIVVAAAQQTVTIEVIDTGIGIRPESIGGLFQAFRQVDGSARRVYEGTGLGLYLCRKLADMLQGSSRAESEFGAGSRFTVVLPRELPPPPP